MGKKIVCDRCGSEIVKPSGDLRNLLNVKFPIIAVNVSVKESYITGFEDIDLCDDCKADFLKWIRYRKETTNGKV